MIKTRAKYFLTLCILLLSFSEQAIVHSCYEHVSYQKIKNTTTSNEVSAGTQQSILAFIFPSPVSGNKENILFDSDEKIEEDEKSASTSSKKNLGTAHSIFISLYDSYAKFFFLKNPQTLLFRENLSHFSHNKLFIVFQVFRI